MMSVSRNSQPAGDKHQNLWHLLCCNRQKHLTSRLEREQPASNPFSSTLSLIDLKLFEYPLQPSHPKMMKASYFLSTWFPLLVTLLLQSSEAFSPSKMKKQYGRYRSQSALHARNDWILAGATAIIISFQLVPSSAALADDASVDIAHGATLFQANCAGCHANGMNYVSEKKTLKKDAIEKYRKTTDVAAIQDFVQKGMPHRFMPFSNEFSDADYKDVVSYVLDQALNDKW